MMPPARASWQSTPGKVVRSMIMQPFWKTKSLDQMSQRGVGIALRWLRSLLLAQVAP